MTQLSMIEERLAHVEKDMAHLKLRVDQLHSRRNWIDRITGSFKDDPEFDEILRLGREIRQSDRLDAE